eukprot:scaffold89772_cov36-Tisochrysis_lutea.AAC.1
MARVAEVTDEERVVATKEEEGKEGEARAVVARECRIRGESGGGEGVSHSRASTGYLAIFRSTVIIRL